MTLGVHQVDGRIAANAAIKIRAALAKSVDAKKVITDYAYTHPTVSEFISQDRARARAWAMHNVTLDHEALDLVLRKHYADMYVTGVVSTYEAFGKVQRNKKAQKNPPLKSASVSANPSPMSPASSPVTSISSWRAFLTTSMLSTWLAGAVSR